MGLQRWLEHVTATLQVALIGYALAIALAIPLAIHHAIAAALENHHALAGGDPVHPIVAVAPSSSSLWAPACCLAWSSPR
jgi:ABC-type nitrate/sulfonate/bicarbonate transport system permease component